MTLCRFVCAMPAVNMSLPRVFRTYDARQHNDDNCTIWEAACATCASPTFSGAFTIGCESFIGSLSYNNPIEKLLEEASAIPKAHGTDHIACIISIGAGNPGPVAFDGSVYQTLLDISHDCERIAEHYHRLFNARAGLYNRFNVEQGLQYISDESAHVGAVTTHTKQYLQLSKVSWLMDNVVRCLKHPIPIVSLEHASE